MRIFILLFLFVSLGISNIQASVSEGKKVFAEACVQCHNNGKYLASQKTALEWKKLLKLKDGTNLLAKKHLQAVKAEASWPYFKGTSYPGDIRHLKDFLQKYSSDRGRHNSCN